jgi:putative salt-induced outer membrane protein
MSKSRNLICMVILSSFTSLAHAEWSGKGEAGIVFARGNSDTDTTNVKLDLARELDRWKHGFGVLALRAANNGTTNAERYGAAWQSDFKLSDRSFWFGNLRYEQDKFSGFDYQSSATTGYGRKIIDSESTKLTGQLGAGYRRSKFALTGASSGDAVLRGDLAYERVLTQTTRLIDRLSVESGSSNTLATNELALQVKMSDAFALSFGLGLRMNTDPPGGAKKTDTLTTLNLVYAFK